MILVCGEALIDFFVSETPAGGLKTEAVLGGSPFNVAIALARLGEQASFCGGLSSDHFGSLLTARLVREHVDLTYSVRSDCLTTLSIVATDSAGHPTYAFHGEGKADRQVTEADLSAPLRDDIKAITFGSYTLAVTPVSDAYLALARREASRRVISLDPNLRPTVTPDMAAWRRRFNDFLAIADIVKASEEDIAIAYGAEADIADIAESWLKAGAALVLITRGPDGAIGFLKSGERVTVPGRSITVVDTVGAGDTFHAALLADLGRQGMLHKSKLRDLNTEGLRRTMHYAVAASSITCTRQGADLPTHEEVLAVLHMDNVCNV
ncbi:carbohydrate kinase family protein [Beijerinckia indica]|uniref:PfkB domain protein n=1 Tax=Beijerinckia indica subsp. indica (strain ATCC 9039 / DSM 1715 / NCIMB 8712) TaxID=395963 RepID=B2IKF5_BEII9|nr:carbohydrate kinase [Beijerinckia indica]ACB96435.1 PfkB domain protein [Beijerinckia indica subsp. indica ATCC 9039]